MANGNEYGSVGVMKDPRTKEHYMKTSDLVFIGIKGSVIALDRATGQQVWVTHLKGSSFVNVILQSGAVLASCSGEIFALDPLTGEGLWHNPLKGFGTGLATIATEANPGGASTAVLAERRRRDEEEAAASSAAACSTVATM
jgi:outer membrane protein assembly factor BamB